MTTNDTQLWDCLNKACGTFILCHMKLKLLNKKVGNVNEGEDAYCGSVIIGRINSNPQLQYTVN